MLSSIHRFKERFGRALAAAAAVMAIALLFPGQALAGYWEYSLGFSFHRSQYSDLTFSWTRTWGTSLSYQFDNHSGAELSYQDMFEKQQVELTSGGTQISKLHDRILSANWIFNVTPRGAIIRPYFKVGIGQLWRDYSIDDIEAEPVWFLSGVLAAGLKIYLVERIALRTEVSTYLEKAHISTWKDNVHFNAGVSIYF